MKILNVVLFGLLLLAIGCTKPPDYPDEPVIEFLRMTKTSMEQGALNNDSLTITISFTDGDGDIGNEDSENAQQIISAFFTDTRTDYEFSPTFAIPHIPDQGAGNGISGEINMSIFTSCCLYPDATPPCTASSEYPEDMLSYRIKIVDRAGNESNVIETPPITLLCN